MGLGAVIVNPTTKTGLGVASWRQRDVEYICDVSGRAVDTVTHAAIEVAYQPLPNHSPL